MIPTDCLERFGSEMKNELTLVQDVIGDSLSIVIKEW
jgi:hypothetical protein